MVYIFWKLANEQIQNTIENAFVVFNEPNLEQIDTRKRGQQIRFSNRNMGPESDLDTRCFIGLFRASEFGERKINGILIQLPA